jgi:hypothetical protein
MLQGFPRWGLLPPHALLLPRLRCRSQKPKSLSHRFPVLLDPVAWTGS